MSTVQIDEPKYDGDTYRLMVVGVDHYETEDLKSSLVLFESKNPHIIDTLAKGIEALIDLALVADS